MLETKFVLLMAFVFAAALAQYRADVDVKSIHANANKAAGMKALANIDDARFMNRAIALSGVALEKDHGHPFGSVVVQGGKIMGEGWSKTKLLNDPTAHAEMEAIRNAYKTLSSSQMKESVIYTSAQPCPMCLSLIYLVGIEKVYYCIPGERVREFSTSQTDQIYETLVVPPVERPVPEISIMESKIDSLIKFYQGRNQKAL